MTELLMTLKEYESLIKKWTHSVEEFRLNAKN